VCTGSFISTNPREEQASAPTDNLTEHNAEDKPHVSEALNIKLIETSDDVTAKPPSADAKVFHPLPRLNVNAPIFDPFGNTVYHESPNHVYDLSKWKNILIEDGLIDNVTKPTHNEKGLTVDTSAAWTAEETYDHEKYTPTTPNPYFHSPIYQPPNHESPMHNGYDYASPDNTNQSGSTPWTFDVRNPYYPTNHVDFENFYDEENGEDAVSEQGSVKITPASPCVNQPVSPEPNQVITRLNDTGSVSKGNKNIVNIVNCNAHGWNSSIKIESTIQMMATKNIHVCTLQETWSRGNWEREIRGYLVLHHNMKKEMMTGAREVEKEEEWLLFYHRCSKRRTKEQAGRHLSPRRQMIPTTKEDS
jgi:hypothetical protein